MATTKQVLRLQSDQTLDDPQIGTQLRLKDLTATRAINIVWTEPAAADWNVEFKDPGADDAVVYENLAATLANKTFDAPTITDFTNMPHDHSSAAQGGPVDHNGLSSLTVGDVHTQYAFLAGRAGGQTLVGGAAAGEDLSLQSTSDVTRGSIVAIDDITMGTGKEVLGLPATPSGATAAASKAYVDMAVSGGASWKETLLAAAQLDDTNGAIAQATALYLANTAQSGDTLTLDDGVTAESWIFAAVSAPNQPAFGASATDSMTDLVNRINTDSPTWAAALGTALQGINAGSGEVVVIYRRVPSSTPTDRVYGTFTIPADAQYVDFTGQLDYRKSATDPLPSVDPGSQNFGFGRALADLTPNEAHLVRLEDSAYVWNEDAATWQLSAGAVTLATSGNGGGDVGQATFDEDFGLTVAGGGIARVKVDGGSVTFDGSGNLTIAGGAVPLGTSGIGGGIEGKVSADEDKGLIITGGPTNAVLETKVDGVSITHNLSGELAATGAPLAPTGNVSVGVLLTRDETAVTPPVSTTISGDVPILSYPDGLTTSQVFDFVVPADYDSGNMSFLCSYQMSTALAGVVAVELEAKVVSASTGSVIPVAPVTTTLTTPPTASTLTRASIGSISNPGGTVFQRGDTIQVYVRRLGGDVSDIHTGSWEVTAFEYLYTGQVNTRLMEPVAETFNPVSSNPSPPGGFFNADIPVIVYSDTTDQAAQARFVVPENWDGASDALLRIQYAMDAAAAGTVRLNTLVRVLDVISGTIDVLASQDFDRLVTADTDPHRTEVIRSVPGAELSPGSIVQVVITRDTSVGGNAAAGFQLINATLAFGVAPISGVSAVNEYYLDDPTVDNLAGLVSADWGYPDFSTDFEQFWVMSSTAPAGVAHTAFAGRLGTGQNSIDQLGINVKGVDTGTVQYSLKVYVEGNGATPAFASTPATPPASSTQVVVPGSSIIPQPTGGKRFFVVVEATAMESGESVSISKPFLKVS